MRKILAPKHLGSALPRLHYIIFSKLTFLSFLFIYAFLSLITAYFFKKKKGMNLSPTRESLPVLSGRESENAY